MEVEGEEERRETALAGTPLLQAGFKSSKVSQAQLDKFRKLHKLRLQMKESAKERGKRKVNTNKSSKGQKKEVSIKEGKEDETTAKREDSNIPISNANNDLLNPDEAAASALTPKKRQKLYWGLDTKERWERKSNM
ncbi:unnamed protein product [Spirodela intermedia]|uniref:Uncharacterized protein n=1 Tax=Spirodela intermedia TaxID=51605 RepID=A0A7I8LGM6_SPIIN|nr:unnamed protein product [Spirodela intermedia]